jgi:hypothetical protein
VFQAAKVAPSDPDLRKKLAECEKVVKRMRFEEALAGPVSSEWTCGGLDVWDEGRGAESRN